MSDSCKITLPWLQEKGFKKQINERHYKLLIPTYGAAIHLFLNEDGTADVVQFRKTGLANLERSQDQEGVNSIHRSITGVDL